MSQNNSDDYTIKSIKTEYDGIKFRSRLEARWAAFFNEMKWEWIYEPYDLDGWFPDFLITGRTEPLLVEVKPFTSPHKRTMQKIETALRNSDCPLDVLLVGPGVTSILGSNSSLGWLAENRLCDDTLPAHDLAWGDALLMDMEKISLKEGEPPSNYNINELEYYGAMSGDISHGDMSFHCRISDFYDGNATPRAAMGPQKAKGIWNRPGEKVRYTAKGHLKLKPSLPIGLPKGEAREMKTPQATIRRILSVMRSAKFMS